MKNKLRNVTSAPKIILLFVSIAVILCMVFFGFEGFLLDYINREEHHAVYLNESGYTKELGLATFEYENIQSVFGSPDHRDCIKRLDDPNVEIVTDDYPGFVAHYSSAENSKKITRYYTYQITIKSDRYHWGWLKIGIGSPRLLVRIAYLFDSRISAKELASSAEDYPDVDEGFYGDGWSRILFCYDENGIVESMAYQPPAFY